MNDKKEWISYFRSESDKIIADLSQIKKGQKYKTDVINKRIKILRDKEIEKTKTNVRLLSYANTMSSKDIFPTQNDLSHLMDGLLTITYASYIAMLEARNKVWSYDYMTFSRRIGELWEPFCKVPFQYSLKPLKLIEPPDFEKVQHKITKDAIDYIDELLLSDEIKSELKRQYAIPWTMVDSGGIKLKLDLHFEQSGIHYNCDFKSGFSSNEKGNVNRLFLVASIYHLLGKNEKNLLFVRQKENENNHYFISLKNSPYWEVYCADDCYAAINRFTGFNMRKWIDNNVDWINDISSEFKTYLQKNNLIKYLTW